MAVAPSVQNSTEPTDAELASRDQLSPTTLVLQALRKAGMPITNDNIRRFIEAHARDTGEASSDLIPGLRSNMPSEDSGPSVGEGGSSAADVRNPKGTGSGSSSKGVAGPVDRHDDGAATDKTTSAQPNEMFVDPGTGMLDWGPLAASAMGAGTGAAALGRQILAGNRPDAFRPVAPVDPMAIPNASQPGPMDTIDYSVMPPEGNPISPMEQAFQRSTEPAMRPTLGATPPSTDMPTSIVTAPRPPGIVPTQGPPGLDIPGVPATAPQVAPSPPQMQFNRPRVGAPANVNQPTAADIAKQALRLFGRR